MLKWECHSSFLAAVLCVHTASSAEPHKLGCGPLAVGLLWGRDVAGTGRRPGSECQGVMQDTCVRCGARPKAAVLLCCGTRLCTRPPCLADVPATVGGPGHCSPGRRRDGPVTLGAVGQNGGRGKCSYGIPALAQLLFAFIFFKFSQATLRGIKCYPH